MPRTVIIGAGSGFGRRLSLDILAHPELREGSIALVDINLDKAKKVAEFVRRTTEQHGIPVAVEETADRREVLPGADFVVTAIAVGGAAYWGRPFYDEITIPRSFGVEQSVADTVTPGGVFRALRTAPVMIDIVRDVEELCPRALVINYTNPMAMITWAMTASASVPVVGLCHSVQGTARRLAGYIGARAEEIGHWVAGINHMSWFLTLTRNGEDAYPALRSAMDDPEIWKQDPVRFEILRHFDCFVTESSRHMSEYVPYFRRTPELMASVGQTSREVPMDEPATRRWWEEEGYQQQLAGDAPIELKPSHEYASGIINAVTTGQPFRFNGNVLNRGIISNLPEACCVEVPCVADAEGVHPCVIGELPPHLAVLNRSNIAVQELTVRAILEKRRECAYYAVLVDPLTASVCPLPKIREMFDQLWQADKQWLGYLE